VFYHAQVRATASATNNFNVLVDVTDGSNVSKAMVTNSAWDWGAATFAAAFTVTASYSRVLSITGPSTLKCRARRNGTAAAASILQGIFYAIKVGEL
jgi:uncharacterized membrane protein